MNNTQRPQPDKRARQVGALCLRLDAHAQQQLKALVDRYNRASQRLRRWSKNEIVLVAIRLLYASKHTPYGGQCDQAQS